MENKDKTENKKAKSKHLKENNKKEIKPIIEKIDNEFKSKQKMPKIEKEKINKEISKNILIAIGIMLYFYFISLGSVNIQTEIFSVDLRVFSIGILLGAIVLFEISYKKENTKLCIYGIEVLVLAILTLFLIYIYTIYPNAFNLISAWMSLGFAIYYVSKGIVIYKKMEKDYYKSLSDIKEIVKKESKKRK